MTDEGLEKSAVVNKLQNPSHFACWREGNGRERIGGDSAILILREVSENMHYLE